MSSTTPSATPTTPAPWEKVIAISGPSGSGKTELICRLVAWFASQGLKVGVLKHSHHRLDGGDTGKDTWRYRQAGAALAALAAPGLLQVIRGFPEEPPLADILPALTPGVDLLLVEGYKGSSLPKVALVGPAAPPALPPYPHIVALVSPEPLTAPMPVFQPHQVAEVGRFIRDFLGLG